MARIVEVERIRSPVGPGDANEAVRTLEATGSPQAQKTGEIGGLLVALLVETRLTNIILAHAFSITDDLERLRAELEDRSNAYTG